MDEENKETVVLGVINRGVNKFDKIAREARVDPKELDAILHKLENSGWIRVDEKKGWVGKKIEINPTEEGYREFERQLKILQDKWNRLENSYKSGNKQELEERLKDDKSFLPTMMMFGIIDIMMFSMMFSMMGMAMSSYIPAEDMSEFDDGTGGDGLGETGMDDGGFDIDIGF